MDQSVDCPHEPVSVSVLRHIAGNRRVGDAPTVLICKLQHSHVVSTQLRSYTADHSLVSSLDNFEVAAQLLDAVDCLPHVFHRHLFRVLIRSHGLQECEAFLLLKESTILFPECDAYIDYLDLQAK